MEKLTKKYIEDNKEDLTKLFKIIYEWFPNGFDSTDIKIKAYRDVEFKKFLEKCFKINNLNRCKRQFNPEFTALVKYNFAGLKVRLRFGTAYPFIIYKENLKGTLNPFI